MARLRVWLLALHAVVLNADDTYDVADILYIPNSKATRQSCLRPGADPAVGRGGAQAPPTHPETVQITVEFL